MNRRSGLAIAIACAIMLAAADTRPAAQARQAAAKQKLDAEYTAKIKEYLSDPRITTELVDHLPASDTVPTPLKFLGHMPGTPGELTHAADIHRYFDALDKASDRVSVWNIGKTEEGRDMIVAAIADEATIKSIDKYKGMLAQLTDPRKTTEEQARQLIHTAKPIYYFTSGMHSPETGGPEMLMELAYRLAVEETPVHPEHPQQRDHAHHARRRGRTVARRWSIPTTSTRSCRRARRGCRSCTGASTSQHDNNRDGMGQFLALTRNVEQVNLDWKPTVLHDLHEAQTYLVRVDRHRTVQRVDRSHHDQRMVDARRERRDRDDQARRARASGPMASMTAGSRTTCSSSRTATTPSAASTRSRATGPNPTR